MSNHYTLPKGKRIQFRATSKLNSGFIDFVNSEILVLKSVSAYCVLDRIIGWFAKRQSVLILFYEDKSSYKSDAIHIDEKIKTFFKTKRGSVELIAMDMNESGTIEFVDVLSKNGIEIFENN